MFSVQVQIHWEDANGKQHLLADCDFNRSSASSVAARLAEICSIADEKKSDFVPLELQ